MLSIGQNIHGYTVIHLALTKSGALMMAQREQPGDENYEIVVSSIEQYQLDDPAPTNHWGNGYYVRPSAMAEPENVLGMALAYYFRQQENVTDNLTDAWAARIAQA